jgi:asparagine synthetase B (glutamine-hydrolysing)
MATDEVVWFSESASVSRRPDRVDGTWVGPSWQPAPQPHCVRATATGDSIAISVPAVWRGHIHLAWRDDHLLASSDLRTLADALSETRPSPSGVAHFLVHGRSGHGLVPSLYQDIWTLQAGYRVDIRDRDQMMCTREWRPETDDRYDMEGFDDSTIRVRAHLDRVVETVLAAHDRVGCLFSGGLDSSLVAAALLRRAPERVVLFNLGSAFGTEAEAHLRARFLSELGTVSHAVDLPEDARLIRSLRATNAVAPLPVGTIFSQVFEEIIAVAQRHGCDAIVTGDGGDEVFAERHEVLVDLLARRRRGLVAAAAHFALRDGQRITRPLMRAYRTAKALEQGGAIQPGIGPERILFGTSLAHAAAGAAAKADAETRDLWHEGWTLSGLGSWRRAGMVPEWEPLSSATPGFSVVSPLVDERVVDAVLKLRREDFVPVGLGEHRKRLLRHAALAWLPADIAMHPKIGSADGELLRRMRLEEHDALLGLLGSGTARRAGLCLPSSAERQGAALWRSDRWVRAAALVAWFDQRPMPATRAAAAMVTRVAVSAPVEAPRPRRLARPASARVAAVAALNVVAQLIPYRHRAALRPSGAGAMTAGDAEALTAVLLDLAQRACKLPLASGSPLVMHRALSWYLALLGRRAAVVRGVRQGQTEERYWIELDGAQLDVSGSEVPLLRCDDAPGADRAERTARSGPGPAREMMPTRSAHARP